MLKRITINGLFGRFNYELSFSNEGIMIITGPNGYGKSTILRLIYFFSNNRFQDFLEIRFDSVSFECKDSSFHIKKGKKQFSINSLSLPYLDKKENKERSINYSYKDFLTSFLDEESKKLLGVLSNRKSQDERADSDYFFSVMRDYITQTVDKQGRKQKLELFDSTIKQIEMVKAEIGKVHFIQEQRLIEKREDQSRSSSYGEKKYEYVTVINANSEKLKSELAELSKKHSSLSNELDSSYVSRLIKSYPQKEKAVDDILHELTKLQLKQEKLKKYGLADIDNPIQNNKLKDEEVEKFSTELSIYLDDANTKYSVFESIINKLELFERIINQKLLFKKMMLSSKNGITVIDNDNNEVALESLSSGEQEIIVLFYKLIFESDVNLLLIDEPEISLHIAWQKEILENLKEIIEYNKSMQIIIATHSPQIIAMNWDLQIDLGGQYNG